MRILNTIIAAIVCIIPAAVTAQETCPLPIMVKVDNTDGILSEANVKFLNSKLQQLVAFNGFGSNAELSHLCLVASVSETGDKQVIAGDRPVITSSFEVSIVLTNLLSGENFGAERIPFQGAGNTESRMLQSALSRINPSNRDLQIFIQNSRVKVFDYYRSHIPSIISQARAMSGRGSYDKALYLLSTVPPCVEGYDTIAQAMIDTFQEYLDVDCNEKLMAARAIWQATQNEEGAAAAAAYLAAIDSRSACHLEALDLLNEIGDRIDENLRRIIRRENEDRALIHELIRGEADMKRKQMENDFLLRQQYIDALRELGQAYISGVLGPMASAGGGAPAAGGGVTPPAGGSADGGRKPPVIIINN